MGAWNTGILDNDTAMDVYGFFEKLYNKQELDIESIKKQTLEKYGMLNNEHQPVYGSDEWLTFALICWECKALDNYVLDIIKNILTNKESIEEEWEELAAKRTEEIEKLYVKIQVPAKRKKTIKKEYIVNVPFREGDCVIFRDKDGIYGGFILLQIIKEGHIDEPNMWTYNWGTTRIFCTTKPTMQDFIDSHFLVVNYGKTIDGLNAKWIEEPELCINGNFIGTVKNEEGKKEIEDSLSEYGVIGNLELTNLPEFTQSYEYGFSIFEHKYDQFEWEKNHPESIDLSYPVKKYINSPENKKKWMFWKK